PILQFVDEAVWHDRSLVVSASNTAHLTSWLELASSMAWNRYQAAPDTRYVFPVDNELFLDDHKYALGTGLTAEERLTAQRKDDLTLMLGAAASNFDVIPKATIPTEADPGSDIVSQGGAFTYYTTVGDPDSLVSVPRATNLVYQTYAAYLEGTYR